MFASAPGDRFRSQSITGICKAAAAQVEENIDSFCGRLLSPNSPAQLLSGETKGIYRRPPPYSDFYLRILGSCSENGKLGRGTPPPPAPRNPQRAVNNTTPRSCLNIQGNEFGGDQRKRWNALKIEAVAQVFSREHYLLSL